MIIELIVTNADEETRSLTMVSGILDYRKLEINVDKSNGMVEVNDKMKMRITAKG